jgi:hypothetical protein
MSQHFGPEWFWDQSRPEAILARARMEEFHNGLQDRRRRQQDRKEVQDFIESSLPRHFLLGMKHLGMCVILLLLSLKSFAISLGGLLKLGRQKGRCA